MTERRTYNADEVKRIRTAYMEIFPKLTDDLVNYWDLVNPRRRPWSFLTTNFYEVEYGRMMDLHADLEVLQIEYFQEREGKVGDELVTLCEKTGRALRDMASKHQSGLSIGICPWTDHGLLQTYSSAKQRATIIVAHDWYPVVPLKQHPFDSPLWVSGLHALEEKKVMRYVEGAPRAIYDGSSVCLFVNLVPDYRPPGDPVIGTWNDCSQWLRGFSALVESACERFDDLQVISWGAPVWSVLRKQVSPQMTRVGVMEYAKSDDGGRPLSFQAGRTRVPYLPLAHPSFGTNYRNPNHWTHLVRGYEALGLGQPGPKSPLKWGDGALRVAVNG